MKELLRTVDTALISYVESLLTGAEIEYFVADIHTSIIEGSIGILPKRILVVDDKHSNAQQILRDANLSHELGPTGDTANT